MEETHDSHGEAVRKGDWLPSGGPLIRIYRYNVADEGLSIMFLARFPDPQRFRVPSRVGADSRFYYSRCRVSSPRFEHKSAKNVSLACFPV